MASTEIITSAFIMLTRKCRRMGYIIREVTEIGLYPSDKNIEDGPSLRKSWKHLICNLKEQGKACSEVKLTLF
jgi:hypothetical protein